MGARQTNTEIAFMTSLRLTFDLSPSRTTAVGSRIAQASPKTILAPAPIRGHVALRTPMRIFLSLIIPVRVWRPMARWDGGLML